MVCHGCPIRIVIPVHRIGDTVGTLSVSPRGIESPSLYWATTVAAVDIALGHLHRCLWGAQFSGSGLFLDCVRMLSRGLDIVSAYQTILCHTIPYHTKGGWISPDGWSSVTVSRPTAVGLAISHRCRLERKSRRWRGK